MLLVLKQAPRPSVILLRRVSELSPDEHVQILVSYSPALIEGLDRVVVSLSPTPLAIRDVPIR